MSEENTPASDTAERVKRGVRWLERIFGADNVKLKNIQDQEFLCVDFQKYVRSGSGYDEVIEWLRSYLKGQGATQLKIFNAQTPGQMMISTESFKQVGLVDGLAQLHFELAEHLLEKKFPRPREPLLPKAVGPAISVEEFAQHLSDHMDGIPVEMQDFIQQLRDAQESKPQAQSVTSKIAIPALEEATGVRWKETTVGQTRCYATTASYANRNELSNALRKVLKVGHRDLPDFSLGDKKLTIPADYIHGGNLGALLESRSTLYPTFTGRQPDQPELP